MRRGPTPCGDCGVYHDGPAVMCDRCLAEAALEPSGTVRSPTPSIEFYKDAAMGLCVVTTSRDGQKQESLGIDPGDCHGFLEEFINEYGHAHDVTAQGVTGWDHTDAWLAKLDPITALAFARILGRGKGNAL